MSNYQTVANMSNYQPVGNYSSIKLLNTLSGRVYTQYTSQSLLNNSLSNYQIIKL